jgi:aminoglycoside phosphotransferase (APT) family kinase protein
MLAQELGANLARLHTITPPRPELDFLPLYEDNPALRSVTAYRAYLDTLEETFPVLEWGLRWCELKAPRCERIVLLHRDYRTGNYMVDEGRLCGVLDWEFTGWGDPREDIGWFTARCWRFGQPECEAGGIGSVQDFLAGYAAVAGRTFSREELTYWQVMAHLRWAIIALQQAQRHLSGQERSLELALTGRMVAELELEILELTKECHA